MLCYDRIYSIIPQLWNMVFPWLAHDHLHCLVSHHSLPPSYSENFQARPRTSDAAPTGGSLPHPSSTRFLPYEELKKATNKFEKASILEEDGFCRVFKGVLSDGTSIAIKRLTNGGPQGDKEFLVEVEMLSSCIIVTL